jgi:hypothetical protein
VSEVRLAAGDPNGRHGLSWRIGSSNDSFYLSCRTLKGTHKVSVHPPSEKGPDVAFFHGVEEPHRENLEDPTTPRIERYYPRELGPGVRRVATIRVCAASLQTTAPVKKADKVIWIMPPDKTVGVDVHVLLMERHDAAQQWCAARRSRPMVSIIDESSLGDLLIYAEYQTRMPGLVVAGEFGKPEMVKKQDSIVGHVGVVAHSIESIDGSLLIEELPVFDAWPLTPSPGTWAPL